PILISFGLASTALVLCALLAIEWKGGAAAVESFEWVSHTLEVQRELTTVEARMSEAESGQRGYILTGEAGYLRVYSEATSDVRARLFNLRQLVAGNSAQLRQLLIIESLSRQKIAELDSTIRIVGAGKRDEALNVVRTRRSDSLMTSIRSSLRSMTDGEAKILRARQKDLVNNLHDADMVSLALTGGLALMFVALLVIARGAEHYRNLVTLCAWTRSVEYEGEWISFEEYLRRKFHLSATHSISPDALAQIQLGLDKDEEEDMAQIQLGLEKDGEDKIVPFEPIEPIEPIDPISPVDPPKKLAS
ncbi:MAG TPA: CHASE3 domain-containing protein, partial [Gemmatimonadaceae bacterium]|nr:CHASE3 domain-containing protein [Gemmatimonadaceae bacterium]